MEGNHFKKGERQWTVERIPCKTAKAYIIKNHYSHGCHNAPSPCYGLYEWGDGIKLIGVLMFATPCSEAVRESVFGSERKDSVIELHRLHILDVTPTNTESWFIAKCLKLLKRDLPRVKAVVSFADSTEGHEGTIYQATNFFYIGKTGECVFYMDQSGRLRHPRQNGVRITPEMAAERGWKPVKRLAKNRYLAFVASSKRERKELIAMCKYDILRKKWCRGCGKEMDISHPGNLCEECSKCQV